MKHITKKLMDGVLVGLGFFIVLGFMGITYAAWTTMTSVTTGDILTATSWNQMLENQTYLKDKVDRQLTYLYIDMSSNQLLPTGSVSTVQFNTILLQKGAGTFNTSTYTFTAAETGVYEFVANLSFIGNATKGDDTFVINFVKNGVIDDGITIDIAYLVDTTSEIEQTAHTMQQLNAGDTIKVQIVGVDTKSITIDQSSGLYIKQLP
ncbi:MAG: hypothetical protein Q8K30_06025 [Candidatus Gracilibacteria bacterium]|nr:hypothetical protein [Candidatus Gracilibacteria bacterium]